MWAFRRLHSHPYMFFRLRTTEAIRVEILTSLETSIILHFSFIVSYNRLRKNKFSFDQNFCRVLVDVSWKRRQNWLRRYCKCQEKFLRQRQFLIYHYVLWKTLYIAEKSWNPAVCMVDVLVKNKWRNILNISSWTHP